MMYININQSRATRREFSKRLLINVPRSFTATIIQLEVGIAAAYAVSLRE